MGVPGQGVVQGLQHQGAAALAHDKAVPVQVKGLAGVLRVVVVAAQGLGGGQRADGDVAEGGLTPTATMVSAAPAFSSMQATVTASMPEEQAVFTVRLGPRMLLAMAI